MWLLTMRTTQAETAFRKAGLMRSSPPTPAEDAQPCCMCYIPSKPANQQCLSAQHEPKD